MNNCRVCGSKLDGKDACSICGARVLAPDFPKVDTPGKAFEALNLHQPEVINTLPEFIEKFSSVSSVTEEELKADYGRGNDSFCEACQMEEATKRLTQPSGIIISVCDKCFETERAAQAGFYIVNSEPVIEPTIVIPDLNKPTDIIVPLVNRQILEDIKAKGYEGFFNQASIDIANLTVEEIKSFIELEQEILFGIEAEEYRHKVRKHTAKLKFDEMLQKLSKEERDKLITNPNFVVPVKVLKSPIADKAIKRVKAKKSLEESLEAMFGEGAEDALRKLGLK